MNGADSGDDSGDGEDNHSHIRPVLAVHGFMHSSEAFTIRQRALDSLPLVLNDGGYDVWLGSIFNQFKIRKMRGKININTDILITMIIKDNRGNKYSHKHVSKKPQDDDFWDFSLDDMARYDLPTMIDVFTSLPFCSPS